MRGKTVSKIAGFSSHGFLAVGGGARKGPFYSVGGTNPEAKDWPPCRKRVGVWQQRPVRRVIVKQMEQRR
jgi:hypothetical protein